jgi:hypothetical protein
VVGRRTGRRAAPPSQARVITVRLICAALIAGLAFAGWHVVTKARPLALSYQGHPVSQAMRPINQAQARLDDLVLARHGVRRNDSRCYYTAAGNGAGSAASPVAVTDRVACGPALFLDGDSKRQYVTFQLDSTVSASGQVSFALGAPGAEQAVETVEANAGPQFVRPDRATPPAGPGGLGLPPAPPAVANVLTRTASVASPLIRADAQALMVGPKSGVRLDEYGFIERYGRGDQARSAPSSADGAGPLRLLAFRVSPIPGEMGTNAPKLFLRVNGVKRGPLVVSDDYVVTAVPVGANAVDLVLSDSGTDQSLSLLSGVPNAGNPTLTARKNRLCTLNVTKPVTVQVKTPKGGTGLTSGQITFNSVELSYWSQDGATASAPNRALLHVKATVRLAGDPKAYGAEAALLSATWRSGTGQARNSAANQRQDTDDVIDVPAGLISGTLRYAGSMATRGGIVSVVTPVAIPFTIATG